MFACIYYCVYDVLHATLTCCYTNVGATINS